MFCIEQQFIDIFLFNESKIRREYLYFFFIEEPKLILPCICIASKMDLSLSLLQGSFVNNKSSTIVLIDQSK